MTYSPAMGAAQETVQNLSGLILLARKYLEVFPPFL